MAIRIDRIKLNRGGPLESDFDFVPGDLNLIYGRNETGKTYVVESLITFLFKTGGRAPVDWDLRDWDIAGKVIVSGLKSDPVSFTKSGNKLEDYWEEGVGLPRNLSRLLVVRAGETLLADVVDGVGRDMLKDYLSGEGLLDRVADRISRTIQRATIQDRLISGDRRGELSALDDCKSRLATLQSLLENVEEGYASGDAYLLRQRKDALDTQIETLQQARRYHAAQLAGQIHELRGERRELPDEQELTTIEMDVRDHESAKTTIDRKSTRLEGLESTSDDYLWAQQAQRIYEKITGGPGGSGPKLILIVFGLLLLTGTVASGLLGHTIALIMSSVGLVAVVGYYVVEMNKALARAGERKELENLKAEYRTRFGSELTDRAALQAKLEQLKEDHILATPLRNEVGELIDTARTLQGRITDALQAWTGIEHADEEWRETIRDLKGKIGDVEQRNDSLRKKLTAVNVPEEKYLDQDPGEEWKPERYAVLTDELESAELALGEQESEFRQLKARVFQATDSDSADWEELITRLREKHRQVSAEYGQLTADILAKIQVYAVVQEFRKQENSRIAEGLQRQELTELLQALTGRYRGIRLDDDDEGLVLVSDQDEEYALADMSTGAREQTFLALRMGFASIAMEGKTGFLILDDAFQHSDWNRRENLVARTLSFVQRGWQVFYFTMDDHIRDLFQDAGEQLGDGFKSYELS